MTPSPSAAASAQPTPGRADPRKRTDPRSPFVFDLRELGRQPGALREYARAASAPAQLGHDVIAVPEGAEIGLELRLESVTEGVLVSGRVAAPVRGQCARCLDPITSEVDVEVRELFAYAASATVETTGEDEIYRVSGDRLDVEPAVRDAIVLALPWTPLCTPDCAGLCPDCGLRKAELPDGHSHESIDPRWAALRGALEASDDRSG